MDQAALRNCRYISALALRSLVRKAEAFEGAVPRLHRPIYAPRQAGAGLANMGHPSREAVLPKPHPSYINKAIEQQFQIGKLCPDYRSALGQEIMLGHAPISGYDKTEDKIRKV